MSADRPFFEPIPVPNGKPLKTLRDAGEYLARLHERRPELFERKEWKTAASVLEHVITSNGIVMMAEIAMRTLINGPEEKVFNPDFKEPKWGSRKKRDPWRD